MPTITERILSIDTDAFKAATEHPFLLQAGNGSLGVHTLSAWLGQDYLYALSYMRFIQTQFDRVPENTENPWLYKYQNLLKESERTVAIELDFFQSQVAKYNLTVDLVPRQDLKKQYQHAAALSDPLQTSTLDYIKFNDKNGVQFSPGLGAIALWGMEKCYFDAWSYAKQQSSSLDKNDKNDQHKEKQALQDFIKNWTSVEFSVYVKELEDLVNTMTSDLTPTWEEIYSYWKTMLGLEIKFWPSV